jgi:hypothetical protein
MPPSKKPPKKSRKKPSTKSPKKFSRQLVYPAPEFTKEELAWYKVLAEGRKEIDRLLAIRDGHISPPWMKHGKKKAAVSSPLPPPELVTEKPGTAAAWIEALHPEDWHLVSAAKFRQEAGRHGCSLSLRAFQHALAKKRARSPS